MDTIVKMQFGSHLYGTSSELSDKDYKGVFIPSERDCFLNQVPKCFNHSTGSKAGKNSSEDIDEEYYSLQYFMKLAAKGEMIIIDMIHAPDEMILESSPTWEKIRKNRSMFYSKNMQGYLGYIRKQTAKYSIKGDRLQALKEVLTFLKSQSDRETIKLTQVWDELPQNRYCFFVDLPQEERWRMYEVGGKRVHETVTIAYALKLVQSHYDRYGARAKQAEFSNGVDWKAVSHAFRAAYQLNELLETNDLKFPLKDASFIRDVKYGKFHYKNDRIGEQLEDLLSSIEEKVGKSDWPEKLNTDYLDDFILQVYEDRKLNAAHK